MARTPLCILAALGLAWSAGAVIPEPDNILYGTITLGGGPVTAANTNVSITAATGFNQPPLASYQMGSVTAAGNYYSLRINLESIPATVSPTAVQSGQTLFLTVSDGSSVRAQATYVMGVRGVMTRLDLAGPNLGQTTHPADSNPTDNAISIDEVVAYLLAWRTGAAWPTSPSNIPLSYAVRAGALWRGGEGYRLDSTVAAPPAWWINTISLGGSTPTNTGIAASVLSAIFSPGVAMTITNLVTPSALVGVFGVEDHPPAGWTVLNISDGGVFDAVNGKVKWGLFFDHNPRALTYQVVPSAGAQGSFQFAGLASFDGLNTLAIGGQRSTSSGGSSRLQGNISLSPNGNVTVNVSGGPNQSVVIQTSTNLVNWRLLSTNLLDGTGSFSFVDSRFTNKMRFYRFALPGQ